MSTQPALAPTPMGKIVTTLTVTNRLDQARLAAGEITPDQVRSVSLDNVLVDSGATTLCLPADVIAQLGLALRREVHPSRPPRGRAPRASSRMQRLA